MEKYWIENPSGEIMPSNYIYMYKNKTWKRVKSQFLMNF